LLSTFDSLSNPKIRSNMTRNPQNLVKGQQWFMGLVESSIRSWESMKDIFIKKYQD
jgi:hypothetical protein